MFLGVLVCYKVLHLDDTFLRHGRWRERDRGLKRGTRKSCIKLLKRSVDVLLGNSVH